jgi:small-conductance mechanosensitive channel
MLSNAWDWMINNAVLVLVITSVIVIVLLLFHGGIRRFLSAETKETHHDLLHRIVDIFYWTVEGVAGIILVIAFVAVALAGTKDSGVFSSQDILTWFTTHGLKNLAIIIAGAVLWVIAQKAIPAMVASAMARPQKGESREGMKRRADTLSRVFMGASRIMIIIMVILVILSEYVPIGPILAGFGVAGIAVGFGAQYLIRDLIAGVFIIMENQYRVGDVARVADVAGQVEEVNLRKTVLRDLDGIVHHIPNGEIRVASNYSRHFARVNLDISVSYGTDLNHAIDVINDICDRMAEEKEWKSVIRAKPQVLRVNKLGDSGIDIKIVGDVKPLEQWRVTGELRLRIKNEFDRVGIEIPWPHTKVYFGNKPGDA